MSLYPKKPGAVGPPRFSSFSEISFIDMAECGIILALDDAKIHPGLRGGGS
jgi:hypothetical protein